MRCAIGSSPRLQRISQRHTSRSTSSRARHRCRTRERHASAPAAESRLTPEAADAGYLVFLVGASSTTSSFTGTIDFLPRPIFAAAALDMSMTRPAWVGPRSLIVTSTDLLFFVFVTLTLVPKASDGWAAVSLLWLNTSPL